eukprot:EG_transcript_31212
MWKVVEGAEDVCVLVPGHPSRCCGPGAGAIASAAGLCLLLLLVPTAHSPLSSPTQRYALQPLGLHLPLTWVTAPSALNGAAVPARGADVLKRGGSGGSVPAPPTKGDPVPKKEEPPADTDWQSALPIVPFGGVLVALTVVVFWGWVSGPSMRSVITAVLGHRARHVVPLLVLLTVAPIGCPFNDKPRLKVSRQTVPNLTPALAA